MMNEIQAKSIAVPASSIGAPEIPAALTRGMATEEPQPLIVPLSHGKPQLLYVAAQTNV